MARTPFYGRNDTKIAKMDMQAATAPGRAYRDAFENLGKQMGGAIEKYAQNKKEGEAADMQIGAILQNMTPERQQEIASGESELGKSLSKFIDGELPNSKKKALLGSLMTVNTADQLKRKEQMDAQRFQQQQELTKLNMQIARQNMARQNNADQLANQKLMANNQFMQSLMSQTTNPQAQRQADIARPGLPALGNADARNRFMQAQLQQPQNQVPVSSLGSQDFGRFAREQGLDPTRSVQRMEALRQAELANQPKAPDPQVQIKNENDLRKEFNSLPEVKDFNKVRTSYDKVVLAGENPSAAGDISMIFNYMKILDPGSVVREGEFATAQNAAGVPQRVINQYNKIVKGERLSEDQRSDFMNQARFAAEAQFKPVSEQMTRYQGVARNMGLRLDQVLPASFLTMGEQLRQKFKTKPDLNSDANSIKTDQGDYSMEGLSVEAQ